MHRRDRMSSITLKKLATSAFIVHLLSTILQQRTRFWKKRLSLINPLHERIFKKNVQEIKTVLKDLKVVVNNLNDKLHDAKRWMGLIDDLVDAIEETVHALEGTFGEHMVDYHLYEDGCDCWEDIDSMIVVKARAIRERLFGPI